MSLTMQNNANKNYRMMIADSCGLENCVEMEAYWSYLIIENKFLRIKLEPIVSAIGEVLASEVLCIVEEVGNNRVDLVEEFFESLGTANSLKVFEWQLEFAVTSFKELSLNKIFSINANLHLIVEPEFIAILSKVPIDRRAAIAIEIVINKNISICHYLTKISLSKIKDMGFQLWLDDYRPHLIPYKRMINWDAVKIDRCDTWNCTREVMLMLADKEHAYIVEGIETWYLYEAYKERCYGLQGYLFNRDYNLKQNYIDFLNC